MENFYHYSIEKLISPRGNIAVKIYNNNAKKEWHKLKYYVAFHNETQREEYINNFKANITTWEDTKAKRKQERKDFVNPAKVGDILQMSWGYDQTNVDYYQVTKVIGKMVEIREIGCHSVDGSTYSHGMADEVKPVKDNFLKDSQPMRKKVRGSSYKDYSVYMTTYADAYKVAETDQTYRSWYA